MDRISTSTKAIDLFGVGKHGFRDGNLGSGILPTDLNAAFFNDWQEEMMTIIEANGLTPTAGVRTQVYQAIQLMIAAAAANDYKMSVRAATVANIAGLGGSAPNTLDGVSLAANDRILVKDQSTGSQNGIYIVSVLGTGASGTWVRATDADGVGELSASSIVSVEEGTINGDSQWMLTTDGAITIGTTAITFTRMMAPSRQIQPIGASVAANALTLTLGITSLDFRSPTLSSGSVNTRSTGATTSLVVPSGATLGTISGQLSRLMLLALDNAGAIELAVVNVAGGNYLDETGLISTTAISAAATAANVVYSTTARTNLPYRVVGAVDSTQAAAGTWATAPSLIQGAGGNAFDAMQSLGYGQTWQAGGISQGTTYYNTKGRPIMITAFLRIVNSASVVVGGVTIMSMGAWTGYFSVTFIVPPGQSYVINAPDNLVTSATLQ